MSGAIRSGGNSGDVYHRLRSGTQTISDDQMQISTGRICGKPAWGSRFPTVKAYPGPLKPGDSGIEFTTLVALTPGRSSPSMVKWYQGSPGVIDSGPDLVCIPAHIHKVVP